MEIILNDDSQRRLLYENQTFKDEVKIVSVEHSVSEKFILSIKSVSFKNCYFIKNVSLNEPLENLSYQRIDFLFENCYFASEFNIIGVKNEVINLIFINSVLIDFKIEFCTIKSISTYRTIFLQKSLINENQIANIYLQNTLGTIFINGNGIAKCSVKYSNDNLYVTHNEIFDLYRKITDQRGIENIMFLDTNLNFRDLKSINISFDLNIHEEGFRRIKIAKNDDAHKKLVHYYPSKQDFNQLNINVHLSQISGLTDEILIRRGYYKSIFINGESESKVNIEHIHCDKLYMHEFSCQTLKIYELNNRNYKDSKFEMKNSNLPNASFVKTLFKDFESVSFYRNFIEKASFSSCTFPKTILTIENIHYPEKKENDYHGLQYELYRQLKFSLLNSQNQIDALEMHQRMYNVASKRNGLSGQDKFILFVNRISNNHATSITRAFWLTFSMIFILWFAYCFFLPNAPFKLGWYGMDSFKTGICEFFKFSFDQGKVLTIIANPVHNINNLSEVNKSELGSMNYLISFVSRILVAWGYFQFISAFRKFGKTM